MMALHKRYRFLPTAARYVSVYKDEESNAVESPGTMRRLIEL